LSKAIAVFTKAPLPGRVKTRLRTCMSAAQAAELHQAFVADTWRRLTVPTGVRRYLYCDQAWEPFEELAGRERFAIQHGVDLGARMINCMKELSLRRHDRILLLGSDSPTLPIAHVEQAFMALDRTDTVLGPTADGGYYAVGCRRPDTRMFADVTWSSEDTLRETEAAFRACSLSVSFLPEWYDVDTEAELARLASDPGVPPNTRRWLDRNPDVMKAVY